MTLASSCTRVGPIVVAVVAVALVPAATTVGSPPGQATDTQSSQSARAAGWQDTFPASSPGYHVLNGVDEVSADDVLAVGVGGPPGGQGRAWQWDGSSWSSTHPQCNDGCGLAAITRIGRTAAWAVGDDAGGNTPVALHWDGTDWTRPVLPDPAPDSADRLRAVSASGPDDVWAAGYTITGSEGVISPLIEHYDGRRWTKVDSVVPNEQIHLTSIVVAGSDDVWAAGIGSSGLVEHWDGHRWSRMMKGLPNTSLYITAMATGGTGDVWAAGMQVRRDSGGQRREDTAVYHWDGTRWDPVKPFDTDEVNNELFSIDVSSDGDVWVVGGTHGAGEYIPHHTLTEHYDGKTWRIVDSPNAGTDVNVLNGVTIGPDGDAWAVGQSSSTEQRTYRPLALHWNGMRWHTEPIRPRH